MTFPLYRLPYVALSNLISLISPDEIFRLSLISKKSYRICKSLRKKPKKLKMYLGPHASIAVEWREDIDHHEFFWLFFVEVPEESDSSGSEPLKINNKMVKLKMDDIQSMKIHWPNDRLDGLTVLCDHANGFYDQSVYSLCITDGNEWRRALNWVLSRQETLPQCFFAWRISGEEEDLRYFFDAIGNRITDFLQVDLKLESETFRYNFRQPITADTIEFGSSPWVTIDNLLQLNCRCLFMQKTSLTSENLNFFLKNWLNGGNSNLGYLLSPLNFADVEVILNGLEVIERDHPNRIEYTYLYEESIEFEKSYELVRNDGTLGSIVAVHGANEDFRMCVWPDFNRKLYPVQDSDE